MLAAEAFDSIVRGTARSDFRTRSRMICAVRNLK